MSYTPIRWLLSLCWLLAAPQAGQAQRYAIDAAHSTLGFSVKVAGGLTDVDGKFLDFEGAVLYDEAGTTPSQLSVVIQAASIDTGHAGRDEHLRTDDFFDVANYPEITFRSTRVEAGADGYVAHGPLTIHGITKGIAFPFERRHAAPVVWISGVPTAVFEGGLTLRRSDFDIRATSRWNRLIEATGALAMSDEVAVRLKVIAEGPRLDQVLLETVREEGVEAALARYEAMKADYAGVDALNEFVLNRVGYSLLQAKRVADALAVFARNVEDYPQSPNVYDSLGEAYKIAGDQRSAEKNYERVLTLDPGNRNAVEMLRRLRGQLALRPGRSITVDGRRGGGEWDDAASVEIEVPESTPVRVYFKHDGTHLLFGFTGFSEAAFRVPEVVLDLNNDKAEVWQEDDWWIHASYRDCLSRGRYNAWETCAEEMAGWEADNFRDAEDGSPPYPPFLEIQIPFAMLEWTPQDGRSIGLAFNVTNTSTIWNFWPSNAQLAMPSTWAEAVVHLSPGGN